MLRASDLYHWDFGYYHLGDIKERVGTITATLLVYGGRRAKMNYMDDMARDVCTSLSLFLRDDCNDGKAVFYTLQKGRICIFV